MQYVPLSQWAPASAVDSRGAGGARAPPEFGGSQKGQSLISAYQSLAITTNTPGFEKLNTALVYNHREQHIISSRFTYPFVFQIPFLKHQSVLKFPCYLFTIFS